MMKMQGNTTEIDERNLLRLDALRNPLHISGRDSLDDLKTRGNGKLPRSPDRTRCEVVESYKRFSKTLPKKGEIL